MKKFLIAAAALAVTAAPIAASAQPYGYGHDRAAVRTFDGGRGGYNNYRGYNRGYGDRGWDHDRRDDRGGAVAAGLFGLFLGAALADNHPYYERECGWETQAYPGPYGGVRYEQVQVCR